VLTRQWLDPAVVTISFVICLLIFDKPTTLAIIALGLITFFVSRQVFDLGERPSGTRKDSQANFSLTRRLLQWAAIAGTLSILLRSLAIYTELPQPFIQIWLATTSGALAATNLLQAYLPRWLAGPNKAIHRFIIIGLNEVGIELLRRTGGTSKGGEFFGFFDYRSKDRLTSTVSRQIAGHCQDVPIFVRRYKINAIYIALPMSKAPRIDGLLRELRDTTATIYFVPDILAFDLVRARYVDIGGLPALSICDTPFHGIDSFSKRLSDVALASLVLLVLSPLLVATALAVKLTSSGPVLFRQRRYGLNGEEISVYKFRSMTVCEDGSEITQATRKDRRITRIGRFLRRSSIDELPQLINVLRGSMSFVGPRPHAVAHNEHYRKLIGGYMIRHKVRPGITGWAQVNGSRGETDTIEKMKLRVQYDLEYLENWSIGLDAKIIFRTAHKLLWDSNAY
jgi:putative colanic acid biosynthesis UDP-glucose lipid carrier transferase